MKILAFVISLVAFVLGLYVMGSAFHVPGFEGVMFVGGILLSSLGIAIPVHVLKRVDG